MPRKSSVLALCGALAVAVSTAAFADPKDKSVIVANDPSSPVPVAGDLTISGGISVVNDASMPVPVEVTNGLPSAPPPVPALTAYQSSVDVPFSTGHTSDTPLVIASVPAGQRLVIEHVSGRFAVQDGLFATLVLSTVLNGVSVNHTIPVTLTSSSPGGFGDIFQFSQPVTIYADGGTQAAFRIRLITGAATGFASMSASGHFVDLMP